MIDILILLGISLLWGMILLAYKLCNAHLIFHIYHEEQMEGLLIGSVHCMFVLVEWHIYL